MSGVDLLCFDDLDLFAREVDIKGSVRQDAYHAITTPRGGLIGFPDACTDVRLYLSDDRIETYGPVLETELRRDQRIDEVTVELTRTGAESVHLDIDMIVDEDVIEIDRDFGGG